MTAYLSPAGFHKHWPSSTCYVSRNDAITGEERAWLPGKEHSRLRPQSIRFNYRPGNEKLSEEPQPE